MSGGAGLRPNTGFTPGYFALRAIGRAFFRALYRVRVEGAEHIPTSGGYIVSLNHTHAFDPPLVGTIVPVQMMYMAKRELFRTAPLAAVLRGVGAIPITRGEPDRQAMKSCIEALRAGYPLSVFPEGTRRLDARGRPRGGAGFLALHAGVPVLPGAILAPYRVGRPLWVRFGPPIDCAALVERDGSGHDRLERLSAYIMREIERIHAELVRDHGDDRPASRTARRVEGAR